MSYRPTPETNSKSFLAEFDSSSPMMQCVDSEFARRLERQRDELLEALEELRDAPWLNLPGRAGDIVEAAIAKAKGASHE